MKIEGKSLYIIIVLAVIAGTYLYVIESQKLQEWDRYCSLIKGEIVDGICVNNNLK